MYRVNLPLIPSLSEVLYAAQAVGIEVAKPVLQFYTPIYRCLEAFRHTQYTWIHMDKIYEARREGRKKDIANEVVGTAVSVMIAVGFITFTQVAYIASLILDLVKSSFAIIKHMSTGKDDKVILASLDIGVDLAHLLAEVLFIPEVQLIMLFTNIITDLWRASDAKKDDRDWICGGLCARIFLRCGINYPLPKMLYQRWIKV